MKKISSPFPDLIRTECYGLNKSSKLPLAVIKGTEKQRCNLTEQFSIQLKNGLEKISNGNKCTVSDFLKLINDIIAPNKINIKIEQLNKKKELFFKTQGTIEHSYKDNRIFKQIGNTFFDSYERNADGYIIELKLTKDKSIIKNKYVAFHEARHLFDYICNPKTVIKRKSDIFNISGNIIPKIFVHDSFLDNINLFGKKQLKKQAEKYLSKMDDRAAIDCLQDIRASLKTEINAYRDECDYLHEKPFKNFNKIISVKLFLIFHNYPKRLKVANQLLAEKLMKCRKCEI